MSQQPPSASAGRASARTSLAASQLMLGQPALGERVRELRSVLGYVRGTLGVAGKDVEVIGDSFAEANAATTTVERPHDVAQPAIAEPLGALAALLTGLFEEDVGRVVLRGGLVSYQTILQSPFIHVPYDVIVPGALTAGDLGDVVAILGERVTVESQIDGRNRKVP